MAFAEEWRPVVGHEGLYEVSDQGRVRNARNGFVKKSIAKKGTRYRLIGLSRSDFSRSYSLHRLVSAAFLGPCPDGMECCHLNGDPADNRAENLAYATRRENHSHKRIHGTWQGGERHPSVKLTEAIVRDLRARRAGGASFAAMARDLGVSDYCVSAAVKGKSWRHI